MIWSGFSLKDCLLNIIIPDMKTLTLTTCCLFVFLGLVGCQRPHPPVQPPAGVLLIEKNDLDCAWDETVEVLREHYFTPDRLDRRSGTIISHPTLSKQWFEFWRDDTQGWYEVTESSIHSMRRIVEVKFVPVKNRYEIQLCVTVQRKNGPERQVTTSSGALMAFREGTPLTTGEMVRGRRASTWVVVGEDVKMANYLLQRIERRLPASEWTYKSPEGRS